MVEIHLEYRGQLRCTARHGPSGQTLDTDAPVDNGGRGEAFSPTDLVATALGSCMLTIVGKVAERAGIELIGARAHVVKHMQHEPVRRIARLDVRLELPGVPPERRQSLERAAFTCPVHQSLSHEIEIPVEFVWS
jgi:putative redox protein